MSSTELTHELSSLSGPLYAFAYKLTMNNEDAKDLFQETAFRAVRNMQQFTPGTNLKGWLRTIMKNTFINQYRKSAKHHTIIDLTDNLSYIHKSIGSIRNDGESNMMMSELSRMVDSLDESLRIPFKMYYLGHKYQDIADMLDLPLGTLKSRLFIARRILKKKVAQSYSDSK